jgi:hypothetical protein
LIVVVAPKRARDLETLVVEVNHDDLRGRVELRRQQSRQSDGARTHDRHGRTWRNLAIQDTTLEAGRQNIAQHHQRLVVGAGGDRIQAGVGMWRPHVFGLRTVDLVAENPAAGLAMGIHSAPAVLALAARRDAGNQNAIAFAESCDTGTH